MNLGVRIGDPRSGARSSFAWVTAFGLLLAGPVAAAGSLNGQVLGGGAPIANSIVTLFAASAGAPKELAQARTGADGRFAMTIPDSTGAGTSLYLVAQRGRAASDKSGGGDNSRIALLSVLGAKAPGTVTINEMTTVASVWTHNQFIDGTAIKGEPLQLKIAAGNVPSFVDLQTGGWGATIQDPLNSGQTPTMANFATLANALAGCVTQVKSEMQTDIAVSPSGDVWAINNWQDIDSCYAGATEALSTRCGGQGVVIFFGMAKPVRAPQIGPARGY